MVVEKTRELSLLVGGEAGQGITRSGSLLGKGFMRGGFQVFGSNDYPSVIRGSHNFYLLHISDDEVHSHTEKIDLILALNKDTILLHVNELKPGGGIIYDEKLEFEKEELKPEKASLYPVPFTSIIEKIGGRPIMINTVALGAVTALVDFNLEIIYEVIRDTFAGRGDVIEKNIKVAEMGYNYVKVRYAEKSPHKIEASYDKPERIMLTGNEAIALGAIRAGCTFYAAYPMTPASPLLHYLASKDLETQMIVIQPENEISALNMVIGASYAGLRSMTATSGGGFCLMTEAVGLAAITETPIVLMVGQRPGPSTGMATYTAQGDLLFSIHSSQGEFPRVVVAPGDIEDCFYNTIESFNLAEKFQIPVLILTDKFLLESHKSTRYFDRDIVGIERGELLSIDEWTCEEEYKRYKITDNGVSPRVLPGTKGATVLANSTEHSEYGYTTIDPKEVTAMGEKRFAKVDALKKEVSKLNPVKIFGDDMADVTMVGWGSTKGPALEALKMLRKDGVKARFVQVVYMEPFPEKSFEEVLGFGGKFILFETNYTSQLGKLIMLNNGYNFEHVYLKKDGRPFNPSEIRTKVKEVI